MEQPEQQPKYIEANEPQPLQDSGKPQPEAVLQVGQVQPVMSGQPGQAQPAAIQLGQAQPGVVVQPGTVVVAATVSPQTKVPEDIGLPGIGTRSFVSGIALAVTGFCYFIVGCAASGLWSGIIAEGVIIGILNMACGAVGIYMKFKLPKIGTIDSLINHTWFFIGFGCISLATGFGALRFVVFRVVFWSRKRHLLAPRILALSAAGTAFVLIILIFSCVLLSCSGSIRRRIQEFLARSVTVVQTNALPAV